jgi:cytochrome c5
MQRKILLITLFYFTASVAEDMSLEAIDARTAPMGQVKVEEIVPQAMLPAGAALNKEDRGKHVYESACVICHASGAAGAPVIGDAKAWSSRIKQGEAVLVSHVTQGFNLMPPKGACVQCSDDDLKAAVHYLVSQVKS